MKPLIRPHLEAILFDMDGTLVSSLPVIHHCVNEISRRYLGRTLTVDQVIASFGPPAREIIGNLTRQVGENSRAVIEYYDCYRQNVSSRAVVFAGIRELLTRIRESGMRMAVVTGIEKILMQDTLDAFDLSAYFEATVTRDDVKAGKPDPEGVNRALRTIGSKTDETIMIGDSPLDIRAGRQAGVFTGAATWGPENIGHPTSENPDFVFPTVADLSRFLFPD